MIKINLLPQKRAKARGRGAAASKEPSSKQLLVGIGALAAVGLLVFVVVDKPKRDRLNELRKANEELQKSINDKNKDLVGYPELQKNEKDAIARAQEINRLIAAKVVPAHLLQELGKILTPNKRPTMTTDMLARTIGDKPDPNKQFDQTWDPQRVWLSSFSDTAGTFKLEGGAQASTDVTQLSKRLAASVHFPQVDGISSEPVTDRDNNLNYVKFTITGKVAY
ncbi:MAG TPA: PilN domain-containing protein [Kofleriaceae bacterium]